MRDVVHMGKKYGSVGSMRLMDIRVIYNEQVVFEGKVEDCPDNIRQLQYSKIKVGEPTELYIYDD